jgi:antitoxin (DNA-binding transcriptional repressor) of toxin-antitoxin stability system
MSTLRIPISEFAAHPGEELALVEKGGATIELTRDGKVIALITPATPQTDTGTVADWIGRGAGFTLSPGCTLEDPAWEPDEWENWEETQEKKNPPP